MHEYSVALNIVEIAERTAKIHNLSHIEGIDLDIGLLSGIQTDSLRFVWSAAVKNSLLENAKMRIRPIPGKGECLICGCEFDIQQLYDPCPNCDSFRTEIKEGKELRIRSLEAK